MGCGMVCCNGAYPRIRGGNPHPARHRAGFLGLSPHTRGKHLAAAMLLTFAGPIPAYAGETCLPIFKSNAGRAYPRIRGGNIQLFGRAGAVLGLSPHTRGKRLQWVSNIVAGGPIPAYAGETVEYARDGFLHWAYPRIRGGNSALKSSAYTFQGLSPHTRGKPLIGDREKAMKGPIPAYAGETQATKPHAWPWRAYPRIRGGNTAPSHLYAARPGLSPHTRGKH